MAKSGEEAIPATVALMSFEGPASEKKPRASKQS